MPFRRASLSPRPVTSTTGVSRVAGLDLMARHTSNPSMPGIMMSSRTTSGISCATTRSAVAPSFAVQTL